VNVTHVFLELEFGFRFSLEFVELLDETLTDTAKSLFGPGEEPINGAFIEKSGEFSGSFSELVSYGGETQHNVQVISDSVDKVGKQLIASGFLDSFFFDESVGDIS